MKIQKSSLGCLIVILIASFLSVATSFAAPPQLKSQYAFTGEASCLASAIKKEGTPINPSGFNETDFTLKKEADGVTNVNSFVDSFSVNGVRIFNGDGTGSVQGTSVAITYDNKTPNASSHNFTYTFTYTFGADGTIHTVMDPLNNYLGTFTVGPRTGQTVSIDKINLDGMASVNNMTLTLSTPAPFIETHTYSNGDVHQAICHRSRVFTWIGNS